MEHRANICGDKIILPASILDTLITMEVQYPMTFEIVTNEKKTHCGVLEFTSEEGMCYIPYWIMKNLNISQGDRIYIRNVSLNKASFIKFKPTKQFIELSDPRATLEYILTSFSCVTIGDKLHFDYNFKEYILEVIDVKPKKACCIIEADIEVDFEYEPTEPIDQTHHQEYDQPQPKIILPEPLKADQAEINKSNDKNNSSNISNSSTKWGKTSKMAHFQGAGNKMT